MQAKAKAEQIKSDSLRNRLLGDIQRPRRLRRVPRPRRSYSASNRASVLQDIVQNTFNFNKPSTQLPTTDKLQTREGEGETHTFLSDMNPKHIKKTMQGESKDVVAKERDDVPEQRVQKAPRLEDDDPAEKLEGDETIEEMVRRVNR